MVSKVIITFNNPSAKGGCIYLPFNPSPIAKIRDMHIGGGFKMRLHLDKLSL